MVPPTVDPRSRGGARELDVVLGTAALMLMLPTCLVFVVATTAMLAPLMPGGESALVAPPLAALLSVTSLTVVASCWCRLARLLSTAAERAVGRPSSAVTVPAPRPGEVSVADRSVARR